MANTLHSLVIKEVSLVDDPANPKAHVVLAKRRGPVGEIAARLRKFLFGEDGRTGPVTAHQAGDLAPVLKALDDSLASIAKDAPADQQEALVKSTLTEFSDHVTANLPADVAKSVTAGLAAVQTDEPVKKSNDGEDPMSAELQKKLDEATAALEKAKKVGDLSDAHKAAYKSLPADAQDKFLAGSDADRTAMCKAAGADTGDTVTKAVDAATAELRKRFENQEIELQKLRDKDELVTFSKRAVEIGLPESDGDLIRKARKGDVEAVTKLEELIKALHAQVKKGALFTEIGKGGHSMDDGSATSELKAKAGEIQKANPSLSEAQAFTKACQTYPSLFAKQREEEKALRKARAAA